MFFSEVNSAKDKSLDGYRLYLLLGWVGRLRTLFSKLVEQVKASRLYLAAGARYAHCRLNDFKNEDRLSLLAFSIPTYDGWID